MITRKEILQTLTDLGISTDDITPAPSIYALTLRNTSSGVTTGAVGHYPGTFIKGSLSMALVEVVSPCISVPVDEVMVDDTELCFLVNESAEAVQVFDGTRITYAVDEICSVSNGRNRKKSRVKRCWRPMSQEYTLTVARLPFQAEDDPETIAVNLEEASSKLRAVADFHRTRMVGAHKIMEEAETMLGRCNESIRLLGGNP